MEAEQLKKVYEKLINIFEHYNEKLEANWNYFFDNSDIESDCHIHLFIQESNGIGKIFFEILLRNLSDYSLDFCILKNKPRDYLMHILIF